MLAFKVQDLSSDYCEHCQRLFKIIILVTMWNSITSLHIIRAQGTISDHGLPVWRRRAQGGKGGGDILTDSIRREHAVTNHLGSLNAPRSRSQGRLITSHCIGSVLGLPFFKSYSSVLGDLPSLLHGKEW